MRMCPRARYLSYLVCWSSLTFWKAQNISRKSFTKCLYFVPVSWLVTLHCYCCIVLFIDLSAKHWRNYVSLPNLCEKQYTGGQPYDSFVRIGYRLRKGNTCSWISCDFMKSVTRSFRNRKIGVRGRYPTYTPLNHWLKQWLTIKRLNWHSIPSF
jgi:hypothetical protein